MKKNETSVQTVKENNQASVPVIKRLPRYHRYLEELNNSGVVRISSKELANKMGVTASQIRQDFNCFGGFGLQGYGYNVKQLHEEIGKILGLDNKKNAIMIGAGNLGRAIASHLKFENRGFNLVGIFDNDPHIIGSYIGDRRVKDIAAIEDFIKEKKPEVAILCIPTEFVEETATKLISLGIRGFWNFTHYDLLRKFDNIAVENVHLGDSLMTLCYQINTLQDTSEANQ
ncbi:MAG: redox-sensing transcriptional repressor Rex [Oscillospiraceae bacterium]|nr:redox-sensing transcriptional repressor Rex [Oscillospiraceae bacterium]